MFNQKLTQDHIFLRSALVAAIYDLNKLVNITYYKDNEPIQVDVPFYIDLGIGSNDRFYRDFYFKDEYKDCVILHNYDKIPRFHMTPTGITLNPDQLTSPFGQADYTETVEGQEKWVTSFIHMLPISINIDFKAKASSFTEVLMLWQGIVDYTIYSTIPSNFVYKGINCDSTIIIDVPTTEKTFEFSGEDVQDDLMGISFSGRIETFYPSIMDKYLGGIMSLNDKYLGGIIQQVNTTIDKNLDNFVVK